MATALDFRVKNGLVVSTTATILTSTNAVSTTTGALQVTGGAGVGRDLHVGGTIFGSLTGTATTATNLAGGAGGSIPYQSSAGTTAMLPIATTSGWLLRSTGSIPQWINPNDLTADDAATVNTVARTTNASHFLTFVDSNNASATAESIYTTSSFVVNPATGNVGIGVSSPLSQLHVHGLANTTARVSTAGGLAQYRGFAIGNTDTDSTEYGSLKMELVAGELRLTAGYATWGGFQTFYTNGSEQMRISANGVGIGTTTTTYKLTVVSSDQVVGGFTSNNATQGATVRIRSIATNGRDYGIGSNFVTGNGEFAVYDYTGNTSRMVISTSGYVGLGRNSPSVAIDVLSDAPQFRLQGSGTSSEVRLNAAFGNADLGSVGTVSNSPFMLYTNNTERLRITPNGGISLGSAGNNVGTSGQVLTSNGDASPSWTTVGSITAGTATNVITTARTTNASHFLTFVDSNNASGTAEAVYTTSSFVVNPATGKVGINVASPTAALQIKTPSVPFSALQIDNYTGSGGRPLYMGVVDDSYSYIGSSYYNNSGFFRTGLTNASHIDFSSGLIRFFTNNSLTANTDFTPTERLRLDSSFYSSRHSGICISNGN
jgi:hypothetical protein